MARQGGLTAVQVRLVTDYMDAHLPRRRLISELAALVDLTRFHFIRSFKQATGMPPTKFMIRRRIDLAKELLAARDATIADVAAKAGFQQRDTVDACISPHRRNDASTFRRDVVTKSGARQLPTT